MKIKYFLVFFILISSSVLINNVLAVKINSQKNIEISSSEEYDMVIISRNIFKSTLQPLIEHKNSHGIKTYFKNVNEIFKQYQGRDKPEQIKYFIKDAIETKNISYVLIIGNNLFVPMREILVYESQMKTQLPIVSDHYYADIYDDNDNFCSWDSNKNDIFGEFLFLRNGENENIDYVDLFADVKIGRIPCFTLRNLQIIVDKIINYENSAYGSDWFNKILLIGGDTFPNSGKIEGEFVTDLIGQEMKNKGFENTKLWASQNNFRFWKINREINNGYGFISYSGHGMPNGICTSRPDERRYLFYLNFNLYGLQNQEKLPIVFFDACLTAQMMIVIPFYSPFAYNIVKIENGGAIAAIGSTQIAYSDIDEESNLYYSGLLNFLFFENYKSGITLGEMLVNAQNDYIETLGKECCTISEYILIGDPSLKVGGYS